MNRKEDRPSLYTQPPWFHREYDEIDELSGFHFDEFHYSDRQWQCIWDALGPHPNQPACQACYRLEIEHCELAYRIETRRVEVARRRREEVQNLKRLGNCLDEVIAQISSDYGALLWSQFPANVPRGKLELLEDHFLGTLRRVREAAHRNEAELRAAEPLPSRQSRPLDAFWKRLLDVWSIMLGREVRQSRELIRFLVEAGRPVAGHAVATPDAARRFLRGLRHDEWAISQERREAYWQHVLRRGSVNCSLPSACGNYCTKRARWIRDTRAKTVG